MWWLYINDIELMMVFFYQVCREKEREREEEIIF